MKLTVAGVASTVYLMLLGVGVLYTYLRLPGASGYRATVALPFNHYIATGDLVASTSEQLSNSIQGAGSGTLLNGYTTSAVQVGQIVRKNDVESRPMVIPDAGSIAFSAEVDPKRVISGEINAGVSVKICDGDKPISSSVRILAVICLPGGRRCTAVLETPATGSDAVVTLLQQIQPSQIKVATGGRGTAQ